MLNIKQEEYEEQRATTTRTKITKRKHLNSKLYNTLHYKKKKKQRKRKKKHDNAFCKLIQNTFSEADLLKCTTKNANTQIKNSKQNKTLF